MFCPNCKNEIVENSKFCTNCGHPIAADNATNNPNTSYSNANYSGIPKNLSFQISAIRSDMMFALLGHIASFIMPILIVIGIIFTLKTSPKVIDLFDKLNIDSNSVKKFAKGYITYWYSFLGLVILCSFVIVYLFSTADNPPEYALGLLFSIIGLGFLVGVVIFIWGLVLWSKTYSKLNELLNSDLCLNTRPINPNYQSNQPVDGNTQVSFQDNAAANETKRKLQEIKGAKDQMLIALILNVVSCFLSTPFIWIPALGFTIYSLIKVKRVYADNNQNFAGIKFFFIIYFIYEFIVAAFVTYVYVSYVNAGLGDGFITYLLNYLTSRLLPLLIAMSVFSIVHIWGYVLWQKTNKNLESMKEYLMHQ
jgi:hypothetical protein